MQWQWPSNSIWSTWSAELPTKHLPTSVPRWKLLIAHMYCRFCTLYVRELIFRLYWDDLTAVSCVTKLSVLRFDWWLESRVGLTVTRLWQGSDHCSKRKFLCLNYFYSTTASQTAQLSQLGSPRCFMVASDVSTWWHLRLSGRVPQVRRSKIFVCVRVSPKSNYCRQKKYFCRRNS